MKLGLIGNGAIARQLSAYCDASGGRFEIMGALVHRNGQAAGRYRLVENVQELLELRPDLVIECAGHEAVKLDGISVLEAGVDLIVVSVGALHDEKIGEKLRHAEKRGNARVIFPSGALAGLESLATAAIARLDSVTLRSSKPPSAWLGTPAETSLDLAKLKSPVVVFDGSAREASRLFPRNANVAASVALCGIGFERTRVVLVADPRITANIHLLEACGAFGRMSAKIEAEPSPDNAKTSMMAALSIARCLEQEAASRKGPGCRPVTHAQEEFRCQV